EHIRPRFREFELAVVEIARVQTVENERRIQISQSAREQRTKGQRHVLKNQLLRECPKSLDQIAGISRGAAEHDRTRGPQVTSHERMSVLIDGLDLGNPGV